MDQRGSDRHSVTVLASAALVLLSGACGGVDSSADASTASRQGNPHWEAVALAESAEVQTDGEGTVLQLDGVDTTLTAFTDRPERLAGSLGLHEFLTLWSAGVFRHDPPNAALVVGDDVLAVELLGAVWDATAGTLWFSVDPLGPTPGDGQPHTGDLIDRSTGPAQLFIDGFLQPVDDQVTDSVTQTNVKVVGEAPAQSMGETYETMARAANLGPLEARSSVDVLTSDELASTVADLRASSPGGG